MRSSAAIGLIGTFFMIVALFVLPRLSSQAVWPFVVIAVNVTGLFFLVRWHAARAAYRCPACGREFTVSPWIDFLSPHTIGEKLLRCPSCRESSWCIETDRAAGQLFEAEKGNQPPGAQFAAAGRLYLQVAVVMAVYGALWLYTLRFLQVSPATAETMMVLKIPLVTGLLPLLHLIFCLFAAREGYRSRIYPIMTGFVAAFLLLAFWSQHQMLSYLR